MLSNAKYQKSLATVTLLTNLFSSQMTKIPDLIGFLGIPQSFKPFLNFFTPFPLSGPDSRNLPSFGQNLANPPSFLSDVTYVWPLIPGIGIISRVY